MRYDLRTPFPVRVTAAMVFSLMITACGESHHAGDEPTLPQLSSTTSATLLSCPIGETRAASAAVPPSGGRVGVARHAVVVPSGAVSDTTIIAIREPVAPHLRVELTANAAEHYQFADTISITLDYSRCPMSEIVKGPLSVWLVDSTGALLHNMGGVDDRPSRTITFSTDHFSGYAIAN